MKTRLSIVLVVVLLLAVTVTALAATFQWKQGYAVPHGKGAAQWWYAALDGTTQAYASVRRVRGDGLAGYSDSEAEAMVCKSYRLTQTGTYQITLTWPLNGRLYADYRGGGFDGATAYSDIELVIRAWQGPWPGINGHKFPQRIYKVADNSLRNWVYQDVNGIYSHSVNYPITSIDQPLKICGGINAFSKVKGYGGATSDFHPAHRRAEDIGTVTVELVK